MIMRRRRSTKVPDRLRPCVTYARVSTVEQLREGYSLDAQTSLLRDYAAKQGLLVIEEFLESESGARTGRKSFGKMLETVKEIGGGCAIVCEKTDRLYRNFSDMVKVDDLRVELHFVKEGIVVGPDSRSNDKFIHSIKVCLAKHFSDNLREEVRKGMTEKARQGIFPSCAPVGYRNVERGHQKVIEPDAETALLVRQVFQAYAARAVSLSGATAMARQIGIKTRRGNYCSRSSIARMLDNPLYMGIVRWNGEQFPGSHDPIVTVELFEQVQVVMHGRKTRAGFAPKRNFAYRGLMKCAYCGCSITAEIKKEKYVYYRCTGMRDKNCPGMKMVREEALTEQFASLLEGLTLSDENMESLKTALRESLTSGRASRIEQQRSWRQCVRSWSASTSIGSTTSSQRRSTNP